VIDLLVGGKPVAILLPPKFRKIMAINNGLIRYEVNDALSAMAFLNIRNTIFLLQQ
jgi:hypothetical protein